MDNFLKISVKVFVDVSVLFLAVFPSRSALSGESPRPHGADSRAGPSFSFFIYFSSWSSMAELGFHHTGTSLLWASRHAFPSASQCVPVLGRQSSRLLFPAVEFAGINPSRLLYCSVGTSTPLLCPPDSAGSSIVAVLCCATWWQRVLPALDVVLVVERNQGNQMLFGLAECHSW